MVNVSPITSASYNSYPASFSPVTNPGVSTAGQYNYSNDSISFSVDFKNLNTISSMVGSTVGGGYATLKTMHIPKIVGENFRMGFPNVANVEADTPTAPKPPSKIKEFGKNIAITGKTIGQATLQGAKYGAIVGGAVSALTNGFQVATGEKTIAEGVGTLTADTITAALAGSSAAALGGITALGLSLAPIPSLTVTAIAAGVGLAGAVGTHYLINNSGMYDTVKNAVTNLID